MKIPKSIKIGAHTYTIKYPYTFKERNDVKGRHSYWANEMWLEDNHEGAQLTNSTTLVLLIHEIIHALNAISGDIIFTDDGKLTAEDKIDLLAESTTQILIDNKYIST